VFLQLQLHLRLGTGAVLFIMYTKYICTQVLSTSERQIEVREARRLFKGVTVYFNALPSIYLSRSLVARHIISISYTVSFPVNSHCGCRTTRPKSDIDRHPNLHYTALALYLASRL
jgi:hypothetical protein